MSSGAPNPAEYTGTGASHADTMRRGTLRSAASSAANASAAAPPSDPSTPITIMSIDLPVAATLARFASRRRVRWARMRRCSCLTILCVRPAGATPVRAGVVVVGPAYAAMSIVSLPIVDASAIFALLHPSGGCRAARILRVLGLVTRAAELDAGRIVRAVARLGDRDAAESTESENACDHDLHECRHRLPPLDWLLFEARRRREDPGEDSARSE